MYKFIREENGKTVPFEWMLARQKAFKIIKVKLAIASVIAYFNFDKLFILYTNVSGGGVRAVLHQKDNNRKEQIIVCVSKIFNEYEKKYSITE